MAFSIKIILRKILMGQRDFCALCLNSVETVNAYRMSDKIILKKFNNDETITKIINFILGSDVIFNPLTDFVCAKCLKLAITSYSFVKICKDSSQSFLNVMTDLVKCVSNTSDEIDYYETMYVLGNVGKPFCTWYDIKGEISNVAEARMRIQAITNERKSNTYINLLPEEKNNKIHTDVIKKEKQSKIKQIPTTEMMLNKNDVSNIKCKLCLKTYPSRINLRRHYIRVHAPKNYKCSKCPRKFGSLCILDQHMFQSHTEVVCSECGKTYNNRYSLRMHELSHKVSFACDVCKKVYKTKNTFKKHLDEKICGQSQRKSKSQAALECDSCGKKFCIKASLRTHIKFEHGNSTAHVCSWCNKRFSALSRLRAHEVKHTKIKNYSCNLCEGKFVTKGSLLYHTRIHTREKPYKCNKCNDRFISSSKRSEHIQQRHMEALYPCDDCHKKFKTETCLRNHKNKHSNKVCDENKKHILYSFISFFNKRLPIQTQ